MEWRLYPDQRDLLRQKKVLGDRSYDRRRSPCAGSFDDLGKTGSRDRAEQGRVDRKTAVCFQKKQANPRSYEDGEKISFFGEPLTIQRTIGPARTEIFEGQLRLSIPDTFSPDDSKNLARDLVTLLYRRLGTVVLDPYVEKYAKLAGVNKPQLRIRLQKKKWGCCTPKNGIIINARVLLAPKIVAEYLVVHEIVHLRFPHHQKNYWDEVKRLMPDYKDVEKLMKTDGWRWEF